MLLKKINNEETLILIYLLIVLIFSTLDGLRDTFYPQISIFRDIVILSIPLYILIYRKFIIFNKNFILITLFLIFILSYSFIVTLSVNENEVYSRSNLSLGGISFWVKYLIFFYVYLFLYTLMNKERKKYIDYFVNIYIFMSLIYCILTILIVFLFPSLYASLDARNWHGRLSIGYPTQDVMVLSLALLFISLKDNIKPFTKLIIQLIILFCILMQNNVTGYILTLFVLILILYKSKIFGKIIISSLIFSLIAILNFIYLNYYKFGTFGSLLQNKIDTFIFGTQNSGSLDLRQEQIISLVETVKSDWIYMLFGYGGLGGFSAENTIYSVLGFSGIIGLSIYIFTLVYVFLTSIKHKDLFLFGIFGIYIISSMSLTLYYLISGLTVYAFMLTYCITIKRNVNSSK